MPESFVQRNRRAPNPLRTAAWMLLAATFAAIGCGCSSVPAAAPRVSGPASVRESFVDSRLGQLHAWTFSPRAVPAVERVPLLFVHQTSLSGREFFPVAAALAADRRVIAVDLPGYGLSAPLGAPVTIESYAAAVEDAVASIGGASQLDVMGMHGGSLVAAQIALDEPRRVRRLVLAGVVAETAAEQAARRREIVRDEPFENTFGRLQTGLTRLMRDSDPAIDHEQLAMLIVDGLRAYDRRWYLFDASTRYDALERLPRLTVPTLLIAFRDDVREPTLRTASILPSASLVDLDPIGTLPYFRATQRIVATLKAFLDSPSLPSPRSIDIPQKPSIQ